MIAIVSYPRSGNHLVRFLVEYVTGLATRGGRGSDADRPLCERDFQLEPDVLSHVDRRRFVGQKAHRWKELRRYEQSDGEAFASILVVVRNPYAAIAGDIERKLPTDPARISKHIERNVRHWARLIIGASGRQRHGFVFYEDLTSEREVDWQLAAQTILNHVDADPARAALVLTALPHLRNICSTFKASSWKGIRSLGKPAGYHLSTLPEHIAAPLVEEITRRLDALVKDFPFLDRYRLVPSPIAGRL